jgi:hypothetical protein
MGMQGRSDRQRELLDVDAVAGHLLPAGSIYAFMAEHRGRLFPDALFEDLFPSGLGRPSVPADVVAAAIVLQTLNGLSDRETAEAITFDLRWKAALGLAVTSGAFHPTTLTVWRNRLAASDRPQRIFEVVRQVIIETGAVKGKTRRAMDSTILDDAVARQDTITQLIAAIRRVGREVPGADVLIMKVCTGYDYTRAGKPDIAWDDQDAREGLVSSLVTDALALLGVLRGLQEKVREGVGREGPAGGGVAGSDRRAGRRTRARFGWHGWALADRPQDGGGPGDLHRGPGCPARAQDPISSSGRIQGPHRDRAGHRADHRDRVDQGQRPGQQ